jgi:hypothetical protein
MRLNDDELLELKTKKAVKIWRVIEPDFADIGRKYKSGGEAFTVMDVKVLGKGALFRHFPKVYEELAGMVGPDGVWMITLSLGDHTDPPNLLTPTGSPGDGHGYTNMPAKAMPEEPEAIARAMAAKFADAVRGVGEKKRGRKRKPQRMRRWSSEQSEQ